MPRSSCCRLSLLVRLLVLQIREATMGTGVTTTSICSLKPRQTPPFTYLVVGARPPLRVLQPLAVERLLILAQLAQRFHHLYERNPLGGLVGRSSAAFTVFGQAKTCVL